MADPARSEPATPRRRQEARKRGQVARSGELTGALVLLAILLFFRYYGGGLLDSLGLEAGKWWGSLGPREVSEGEVVSAGLSLLVRVGLALAPLLTLALFVAVGANILQFGVLFSGTPVTPKIENLSPVRGFKRIFSQRTLVEFVKAMIKLCVVSWVVYAVIKSSVQTLIMEAAQPIGAAFATAADLSFKMGIRVVLALLVIAVLDYLYQRFDFERNLKMTRQEVRDEYRQLEGDPLIKARIRQMQREVSRRRMMTEIPHADVVITNPVHLAVALKYQPGAGQAPVVVAKGARLIAERIKAAAREHMVPIYEDPPLAQALFQVAVGRELPSTLYHAVAQVLAFVYHTNKKDKEEAVLKDILGSRVRESVNYG